MAFSQGGPVFNKGGFNAGGPRSLFFAKAGDSGKGGINSAGLRPVLFAKGGDGGKGGSHSIIPRPSEKGPPGFSKGSDCGKGGLMEENRSMDWYCNLCRERNFAKRMECFKCKAQRQNNEEIIQTPRGSAPPNGTTMQGMVKTYNKKGFGFIMCLGGVDCQDVHYKREDVCNKLFHPDMPGEHVSFEIYRSPDCRLTARNVRRVGADKNGSTFGLAAACGGGGGGGGGGGSFGCSGSARPDRVDDDGRAQDWVCSNCRERNYARRLECYRCKAPPGGRPPPAPTALAPRRTFSPHAGARAIRESLAGGGGGRRRSSSSSKRHGRSPKRRRGRKSSSSSSDARKRERRKGGKKRKSSSSSSDAASKGKRRSKSSSSSSGCEIDEDAAAAAAASAAAAGESAELQKAKADALEQLVRLKSVEPKEARMTEWRALLRQWHPDKNPERTEVATAVFQFLQKGKMLMDAS